MTESRWAHVGPWVVTGVVVTAVCSPFLVSAMRPGWAVSWDPPGWRVVASVAIYAAGVAAILWIRHRVRSGSHELLFATLGVLVIVGLFFAGVMLMGSDGSEPTPDMIQPTSRT